jgi:hypothetical protein
MTINPKWGIGFALVMLLLAITWSLQQEHRPVVDGVEARLQSDPDAERLARLEQLVARQQAQIIALSRATGRRAAGTPAVDGTLPTPAQQRQAAREQQQELARIAKAWTDDRSGGADAAKVENTIRVGFDAEGVLDAGYQPEIATAWCKEQLCMVEAQFSKGADPSEWLVRLQMEAPDALSAVSATALPANNGKQKFVVYAARRGHEKYLRDQQPTDSARGQPRG